MTDSHAWTVVDTNGNIVNIVMWDGITPYNPDVGLSIGEVATQADYASYNTYVASQQPANTAPNPTQFFADVASDPVCQSALSLLATYQYTMDQYSTNPQACQLIWSQLCANNSSVITSVVQTAIEAHATANNMPLQ